MMSTALDVGRPVTVQYFKYPDILHWRHDSAWLGEDQHGTWLGAAAGSTVQRGDEPPIRWPTPFVQLIPRAGWFTVIGNPRASEYELYIDIVTTPKWIADDRVEMVDVDLDVVRDWQGGVAVLDEDEFAEHTRALAYPDWMVDRARTTTAEVVRAAERGAEPFGTVARQWLARLDDR